MQRLRWSFFIFFLPLSPTSACECFHIHRDSCRIFYPPMNGPASYHREYPNIKITCNISFGRSMVTLIWCALTLVPSHPLISCQTFVFSTCENQTCIITLFFLVDEEHLKKLKLERSCSWGSVKTIPCFKHGAVNSSSLSASPSASISKSSNGRSKNWSMSRQRNCSVLASNLQSDDFPSHCNDHSNFMGPGPMIFTVHQS